MKYDIDGFMLSREAFKRIRPDKKGKRWAFRHRGLRSLESKMRAGLAGRSELAHMIKGRGGFEILVRHMTEKGKVFGGGGAVLLIA